MNIQFEIPVYYLSLKPDVPCKGFWDYAMIEEIFEHTQTYEVSTLPRKSHAIIVIPGRSHGDPATVKQLKGELDKIDKKILFIMGDEEHVFPIDEFKEKDTIIYVQNPDINIDPEYRKLGCGYTPHVTKYAPENIPEKKYDFFFAGQITHERRSEMVKYLRNVKKGILVESKSFTKGISQEAYVDQMSQAKIVPCPSGPQIPDTFRLYEALELGCVPIADIKAKNKVYTDYWQWLFDSAIPFPTIQSWEDLPGYINDSVKRYPALNNIVQAWWFRYKNKLYKKIVDDIKKISGDIHKEYVTVVIPISPIPSHPDTAIFQETYESIRYHHPSADIILTFDGVRPEQQDKYADYQEHIRQVLWIVRDDKNVIPYVFDKHLHQVGMMREIIDTIQTPQILYIEHDCPLVTDYTIEWTSIIDAIESGKSNLVRFHFEAFIPEPHKSLMLKQDGNLMETAQWSQRPHIASTAFYRRILRDCFSEHAKCFIEDMMHGIVVNDYLNNGRPGWQQWRLHIYYPPGVIKRSYTTDGRAGSQKFDTDQIW